jgi:hypothetical protein
VDPGFLAGAVEDVFLLGPLYIATGVGLWLRRPWVVPVGLMTGATIFYAIIGLVLSDVFAGLPTVTNGVYRIGPRTCPISSIHSGWFRFCPFAARSLFDRKKVRPAPMHLMLQPSSSTSKALLGRFEQRITG